ncbi:hypothetical protein ABW19_dt0203273 [Dactylella cylindrospora]|nr:hypothetical protein ABW19_dt0203273 [Dactylella cylindrospora]
MPRRSKRVAEVLEEDEEHDEAQEEYKQPEQPNQSEKAIRAQMRHDRHERTKIAAEKFYQVLWWKVKSLGIADPGYWDELWCWLHRPDSVNSNRNPKYALMINPERRGDLTIKAKKAIMATLQRDVRDIPNRWGETNLRIVTWLLDRDRIKVVKFPSSRYAYLPITQAEIDDTPDDLSDPRYSDSSASDEAEQRKIYGY